MLSIAVLSSERAARPGRADRTVTRHLSQAGSYQVTTARTGRPDATDAAPGPGIDRSASTTPKGGQFRRRSDPEPEHRPRMFTVSSRNETLASRPGFCFTADSPDQRAGHSSPLRSTVDGNGCSHMTSDGSPIAATVASQHASGRLDEPVIETTGSQ